MHGGRGDDVHFRFLSLSCQTLNSRRARRATPVTAQAAAFLYEYKSSIQVGTQIYNDSRSKGETGQPTRASSRPRTAARANRAPSGGQDADCTETGQGALLQPSVYTPLIRAEASHALHSPPSQAAKNMIR